MSEVLTPIVFQLGAGGIAGFVVGYAVKKLAKIIAVVAGIFFLILLYLSYVDIIHVNYDKLKGAVEKLFGATGGATNWLTPIIANLPFAAAFTAGLGIGLKVG